MNWLATVYHGLPSSVCPFHPKGGDYLAFLGRISPEKRPDRAIEIAKRAGVPLKIAAKVDKADQDYFDEVIRPLLDHPLVEFVGEVNEHEKCSFLGNALALLFPIDWPEPFGLVMIEAMSAGTPVIAWRHGSVSEVIEDGSSGVVVELNRPGRLSGGSRSAMRRNKVRGCFEARFMAGGWPAPTWPPTELCCPARSPGDDEPCSCIIAGAWMAHFSQKAIVATASSRVMEITGRACLRCCV